MTVTVQELVHKLDLIPDDAVIKFKYQGVVFAVNSIEVGGQEVILSSDSSQEEEE